MTLVTDTLAYTTVRAPDRMGRVEDFADRRGKGEERDILRPVVPVNYLLELLISLRSL